MDHLKLNHLQTTLRILILNMAIALLFWVLGVYLTHIWVVAALLCLSILFSLFLRNLRQRLRVNN
jgi:hypothetical protein